MVRRGSTVRVRQRALQSPVNRTLPFEGSCTISACSAGGKPALHALPVPVPGEIPSAGRAGTTRAVHRAQRLRARSYVDRRGIGSIEAKKVGETLLGVEPQADRYSDGFSQRAKKTGPGSGTCRCRSTTSRSGLRRSSPVSWIRSAARRETLSQARAQAVSPGSPGGRRRPPGRRAAPVLRATQGR